MFKEVKLLSCYKKELFSKLEETLKGYVFDLSIEDGDISLYVDYDNKEDVISDFKTLKIEDYDYEEIQSISERGINIYSMGDLNSLIGDFFSKKLSSSNEVLTDKNKEILFFFPEN